MIENRKKVYYKKYTNKDLKWWKEINEIRNIKTSTAINQKMCNEINDHFYETFKQQLH